MTSKLYGDFSQHEVDLKTGDIIPLEKISPEDTIVVTPGSNDISPKEPIVEQELSPLKKQRMKEKEKKEQRKMQKQVDNVRKKQNEHHQKEQKKQAQSQKGFDVKSATWREAQSTAMDVANLIGGYETIAVQCASLLSNSNIELTDEGRDMISSRVNLVTRDIQNFRDKWQSICEPMSGRTGKVLLDEFPIFYLVYEELLQLHQEVNNVLIEQSEVLSGFIDVVMKKAKEVNDKAKSEQQENVE